MIGSHVLVQQRRQAPYRGQWSLPLRILTDALSPPQVVADMARECGHLEISDARVFAIDSISVRRDGLVVPALHILYKAHIQAPMRPDIDTWGSHHALLTKMCHIQLLSREKMAFGQEKYLRDARGEYE